MQNQVMGRENEKGAIALEYILIAALVAIALISTFVYFRKGLTDSTKQITETTTSAVSDAIETGTTEISSDSGGDSSGSD